MLPEGTIADFLTLEKVGDQWQLLIAPTNFDQETKSYTLTLAVIID